MEAKDLARATELRERAKRLYRRALAHEEAWGAGAIHGFFIASCCRFSSFAGSASS